MTEEPIAPLEDGYLVIIFDNNTQRTYNYSEFRSLSFTSAGFQIILKGVDRDMAIFWPWKTITRLEQFGNTEKYKELNRQYWEIKHQTHQDSPDPHPECLICDEQMTTLMLGKPGPLFQLPGDN